jgi:hypothetical protein
LVARKVWEKKRNGNLYIFFSSAASETQPNVQDFFFISYEAIQYAIIISLLPIEEISDLGKAGGSIQAVEGV